jgi:transcriptional regulator with XRE-family HTH domain
MSAVDPGVQRRRLRIALRKAREDARLTQREVAEKLDWSLSKIIRIEAGSQGLSVTDLKAMCDAYEVVDKELIATLTAVARGSRGPSWWTGYRDLVSPQFAQYLDHEDAASSFQVFNPLLVPGLLHTEDYAVALLSGHPDEGHRVNRIAELRMRRQDRVFQRPQTQFEFILDEEALHRWIGGAAAMRRQLEHLRDMSGRPNVSIDIVPYSGGAHAGLRGGFSLLHLDQADGDLVFLEGLGGDQLIRDDPEQLVRYAERFERLRDLALPPERGDALLEQLISGFDRVPEGAEAG